MLILLLKKVYWEIYYFLSPGVLNNNIIKFDASEYESYYYPLLYYFINLAPF